MTAVEPSGPEPVETARARLAAELRSAYENGARIRDLAVASHRAQSEVRRLLREAGAVLGTAGGQRPSRIVLPGRADASGGPVSPVPGMLPPVPFTDASLRALQAQQAPPAAAVPPASPTELGVLIGAHAGTARAADAAPPAEPRRVAGRVIRVGEGTCFVVLPEWRSAIAVPVATSVLLTATGLPMEHLLGAELTVRIRPDALHDRELEAADWQPAGRRR